MDFNEINMELPFVVFLALFLLSTSVAGYARRKSIPESEIRMSIGVIHEDSNLLLALSFCCCCCRRPLLLLSRTSVRSHFSGFTGEKQPFSIPFFPRKVREGGKKREREGERERKERRKKRRERRGEGRKSERGERRGKRDRKSGE